MIRSAQADAVRDPDHRLIEMEAALERLRLEQQRYQAFVEQSTEGIWCFEVEEPVPVNLPASEQIRRYYASSRLTFCNEAMAHMYGLDSAAQLIGARLADLLPDSDPGSLKYLGAFVASGHRLTNAETRELDRDGHTKHFLNNLVGIVRDGCVTQVWGTQRDVTEQRRLEDQLCQSQKMEAIGRLAGGVAHDFNNLLNVIVGYGGLLAKDLGDAPAPRGRLEQILKAAERAAALTGQLLAFSRKQILEPRVLGLNALVQDQVAMLARLVGEEIELETALCATGDQVKVDPGQFAQVLMNLVVNARDAMPSGGRVRIGTIVVDVDAAACKGRDELRPGSYVMLAVRDEGTGMDPQTLGRIFEPFFTTKEAGRGTGLGLATVYGIVKQSGGSLTVSSEPGRGTTFCVYLPRCREAALAPVKREPVATVSRRRETVLLVEDETSLRELIRELLADAGFTVIEAAGPAEALAASETREGPIHLLLTDLVMPGGNGCELARLLAESRPEIKVLLMTGYTDHALLRTGVEPGAPLLMKPFAADELVRRLRAVLDAPSA